MSQSEIPNSSSISEPTSGVSRRAVLLAGAWAAPAIVVASAVPAASASVVEKMQIQQLDVWFGPSAAGYPGTLHGVTTVFLEGDVGASVAPVTVVISVPAAGMSTAKPAVDPMPIPWVAGEGVVNGAAMEYRFTYGGTLVVGAGAWASTLVFHLASADGVILTSPRTVSEVAMAAGAESAGAQKTAAALGLVTAVADELTLEAGDLALGGTQALVWSGASISYSGAPQPALVEYIVELRGPLSGDVALLAHATASVSSTPTVLGPITYTAPPGLPLTPGNHSVVLTVVGVGGVRTVTTAPVVVV